MKKITLLLIAVLCGGLAFGQAPKKVILEDFTGTGCGYCPRGTTTMENIEATYPNAIGIADHAYTSTSKLNSAYSVAIDAGLSISAYPNGAVDRFLFSGETTVGLSTSKWTSKVSNRLLSSTPVSVNFTSTYNSSTRLLDVIVTANFVGAASGDLRINCVLMEDGITGYPQQNYMGNGCSSPDPTSPWYNYPCVITNFVHNHVAKINLANDNWGTAGVIPSSVTSGSTYTQAYSYTLPTSWPSPSGTMSQIINTSNVYIVAFVSKYGAASSAREILNSNKGALGTSTTGIIENQNASSLEVKQNTPNPFSNITALQFTLNTTDNVSIKVYNAFGQVVNNLIDTKLVPGEHTFYWAGDDNDGNPVAGGVYYYTISTSSQQVTKPMIFVGQ